jgi:hypothetical protein
MTNVIKKAIAYILNDSLKVIRDDISKINEVLGSEGNGTNLSH